jgi:hypothetical protein
MLEIRRFQPDEAPWWDRMVWQSNNGTLFHTRRFLSYHPPDRFTDHSLVFYKKGKPYVLFPAAALAEDDGPALVSHPGATFGSFVVPEDLPFADAYQLVRALKRYAREQGFHRVRLPLPPTIYNRRLSNYIDFALLKHGFRYRKREVSSILFLEQSVAENLAKFRPSHRRAVRRAQRLGVTVSPSEDYATFYDILTRNLKIRHNVRPTHTLEELLTLRRLFPERIRLFGAFVEDRMVAGVVNFIVTDEVVLAFYISHDESYQEYRPVNLLFYSIFEWAIAAGFKVFDFGIFTVNEEPNFGLGRFKESFGASGMFRDTLEIAGL